MRGAGSLQQLAMLGILAAASGCVRLPSHHSVAHWWDSVRWSASQDTAEPVEPPTVSANVARINPELVSEDEVDPTGTSTAVESPVAQQVSGTETPPTTVDPFAEPSESVPGRRIRELKAALSADVSREADTPGGIPGLHSLRVRVDGLLRRTRELASGGDLQEARRTAQLAAELSDSLALEFLPTEDRPNDLLREIDDQLTVQRAKEIQPVVPGKEVELRDSGESSDTWGTVVANGPHALGTTSEPADVEAPANDLEVLPVLTVLPVDQPPTGSSRLLTSGMPWKDAALDADVSEPRAPALETSESLPRVRQQPPRRTASPVVEAAAGGPWLAWNEWLALGILAALLTSVGLVLQIRRWRQG